MRTTVLRTDRGTRLFWTFQDNRGYFFDAEGCYQYCQENGAKGKIQARKLIHLSKKILDHTEPENWYRYRNNFMDLEIDIVLDDWNVVQLRIPDHGWLYIPNEPEQTGTYLCICISALHDTEARYLQIMEYDIKRKYWHDPGKEHNNNHLRDSLEETGCLAERRFMLKKLFQSKNQSKRKKSLRKMKLQNAPG